jgi:Xaa-Pro aminopeptidase
MFLKEVYQKRRKQLRELVGHGLILIAGNEESPMNYRANTYRFRQDSTFLYFFGIDKPGFYGICDTGSGVDALYGNDLGIDDIVWMGEQPSVRELAAEVAVGTTGNPRELENVLRATISSGRQVHLLPAYRGEQILGIAKLLGVPCEALSGFVSEKLIRAVVTLRAVKDPYEIAEIEKALEVAGMMHTTAMRMAFPGNFERDLAGTIEGIALSQGGAVAFPVILSMDGQTLHNHFHGNMLADGRLVVCDTGAETEMGYASDITRTFPVGGKFSTMQKEIYNIVLSAHTSTIEATVPGITYREVHLMAARIIASGLKDLGIMRGDMEEAVAAGAHALFFPHGLGHMMGLDVHDMEGLGENYVGYDATVQRSDQFGLAYLRMGRELKPGFVMTNEPGCYFIPALIGKWKTEKRFERFINYRALDAFMGFGGVRIEDDILVTEEGRRILGIPIPKTIDEVEAIMSS